jgi:hypothetical protein
MVPQPQIYFARLNLKNVAALLSILNLKIPPASSLRGGFL